MSNTRNVAASWKKPEVEKELKRLSDELYSLCVSHGYKLNLAIDERTAKTLKKIHPARLPKHDINEVIVGFRTMLAAPDFREKIREIQYTNMADNEFTTAIMLVSLSAFAKAFSDDKQLLGKFVDLIASCEDNPDANYNAQRFLEDVQLTIEPKVHNGVLEHEFCFGWFVVT
jgi:hypothetical protein